MTWLYEPLSALPSDPAAARSHVRLLSLCSGRRAREWSPPARVICYVEEEAEVAASVVADMEAGLTDRAPLWGGVESFDGSPWRGRVDLVVAHARTERDVDAIARLIHEVDPGGCIVTLVPRSLRGQRGKLIRFASDLGFLLEWDRARTPVPRDVLLALRPSEHGRLLAACHALSARESEESAMVSPCVEWKKACDSDGYGMRSWHGKSVRAHRVAWMVMNGPIPDGLHVLHSCDNRRCVNVDHLRLGTHQENMRDRAARWRSRGGSLPGESNPNSKLTPRHVKSIRALATKGVSQREIARSYGVSQMTISKILRGETWRQDA